MSSFEDPLLGTWKEILHPECVKKANTCAFVVLICKVMLLIVFEI